MPSVYHMTIPFNRHWLQGHMYYAPVKLTGNMLMQFLCSEAYPLQTQITKALFKSSSVISRNLVTTFQ
jgi:hypothetical protein